jgi:hypothetical protein
MESERSWRGAALRRGGGEAYLFDVNWSFDFRNILRYESLEGLYIDGLPHDTCHCED